ncbi:MAG: CPBP family intramembrane glutamic endopeptidase [Chloroflexota bacterium]|nr:CPBP family intramembrane glutamic endopeptidase [Chloroflexota bacterium]
MITPTNKKRIFIYLAFAFGISWTIGLVIFLTGGLENSPSLSFAGVQVTLAYVLLATIYMFGPAIANILTRLLTKEGKKDLFIQPHFDNRRWHMYIAAWLLPGVLTIAGIIIYFLLFPWHFDAELTMIKDQISQVGSLKNLNPWFIIVTQTFQALLLAPLLNAIPIFGEEFGWRGYLQPKLMPLGGRKAVLLTGSLWGIWHWPIILMGHNYGSDYFGAPFLGPLAMVWFTISLSIIFGWITIKADNFWPAVIAHGALNGIASHSLLFVQGNPDPLLGPTPVGIIGGIGLTVTALLIYLLPNSFHSNNRKTIPDQD